MKQPDSLARAYALRREAVQAVRSAVAATSTAEVAKKLGVSERSVENWASEVDGTYPATTTARRILATIGGRR